MIIYGEILPSLLWLTVDHIYDYLWFFIDKHDH